MVSAALITNTPTPDTPFKYGLEVRKFHPAKALENQTVVKDLYPGVVVNSVIGADAVGIVESKGTASVEEGERVLLCPSVNWDSNPAGPEGAFRILGLLPSPGTFAETINIDSKEVFPCPAHLSTAQAAALPLAGLTAYRALFTKCQVQKGYNVLVTGIGGGVALFALQFALAAGANVFVTSSSPEKIEAAKKLGAEGGINYKDPNAIEDLKDQLNGRLINAVVDGSGGDLFAKLPEVMAQGGIITTYGDTASPNGVIFDRNLWARNCELKGTAMGSRAEFAQMLEFVDQHKVKPVVSHSFKGLTQTNLDKCISILQNGQQMGKVVIEM
ncbi:hypothetical protein INT45_013002 [Circinella minor]|uniref:Enoyl reductase (ER) domain-containing protein n=1 Tax=Circinella minor TaxID=1195481 RepID=A0A8H7RWS9_9FUNG|nr:hypothetical protein INT45_013002 [Circinella minor]